MTANHPTQYSFNHTGFSPIPDPWDNLATERATLPPQGWMIPPLDTGHELTGSPAHAAIPAHEVTTTQAKSPVQSAIAILLADQLKLANRLTPHLRQDLDQAITLLEFVAEAGA